MIYFITGNAGKFREVKALIPEVEQLKFDLDEIQSLDSQTVIEHKLNQAATRHDGQFIVEDTSLSLACLGGKLPGTFIKWADAAIGLPGIADLAARYDDQSAVARTVIGYHDAKGENHYVSGEITGQIVAPRGGGFGWDAIFVPEGYDKTFGELGPTIKSEISMRRRAIEKLRSLLASEES